MSVIPYEHHDLAPLQSDPTGGRLIAWSDSLSAAGRIAQALCTTSFVPRHFAGKPAETAAALLLGDELGFSPVSALRSIFVISGTPGLYARSMVALVQSRGHEVWTETDTTAKVVVCGKRRGSDRVEKSEWTTDRARRAGYTNNKKYETDPQAMLYARAASDVCRKIAADVLAGVPYTVEELELIEAEPTEKRTVRRRTKAEAPPMPEPDLDAAQIEADPQVDEAPPADEASDLITKAQLTKLHACLTDLGVKDRDAGLRTISNYAGREVESSKHLSRDEASRVIDGLSAAIESMSEAEPTFDGMA